MKASNFGELKVTEWQKAGLFKPSVLKAGVTIVEESVVLKTLGDFEVSDENNLRDLIEQVLG